ncbi:DUF1638 domain-containing protein [Granulosicoccus antarcticus]|uniref:DUF1638 domain-containing protein n=1 Tax=Granulosicoccus antarcticus IMCC3135 TaxID=1192854 RepID=A0A2Z2NYS7_9GAMM|nr:DUF1638 domain-containing protein [Granulosicoccus antarcticus]ASJ75585.1 hypothetical protein IMCC3135_27660 [Granulosicoccus antarcticus IMCC3135]
MAAPQEIACEQPDAATLVIACGAIAHELVAVLKASQFGQIDIQCLPAEWHNTPHRIAPAVEQKISQAQGKYSRILVAYGDCGTGGRLDQVLEKYQIQRLPGDHCYSFFAGKKVFEAMTEAELGTFYLTDYLVDNFERLILEGLGISRHPELLDQYFSNYTRVMYLAQDDSRNNRQAQAVRAASSLGLPLQVHQTGLQAFEHAMSVIRISAV